MESRIYEIELGRRLLSTVSRSFYLSIKVLPTAVRPVIALGYLLARASDTIADTAQIPVAARLSNLEALRGSILDQRRGGLPHLMDPQNPGERMLLKRLPECLNWLQLMPTQDRADIRLVLGEIIRGQQLDLERFADPTTVVALATSADLDEYTYLVAGCVGRFWTRVSLRHLKGYSKMQDEALCLLGVNFGKGLQLVNILRDLPADLRAGRCYLPLLESGLDPKDLIESPCRARPLVETWIDQAELWLEDGFRYIEAIRPWRSRYSCILPWKLGIETLARLRRTPALESPARIKVSRPEVRSILFRAFPAALINSSLAGMKRSVVG